MASPEHTQNWRKRQIKLDNCPQCGNENDNENPQKRCTKCLEIAKIDNRRRRQERYDQGLCVNCGKNPYKPDRRRCEQCCIKQNDWYKNSEYKDKNRVLAKHRRKDRRARIIDHYGSECVCCGELEPIFLSIDHINNDGADHRAHITKKRGRGKAAGSTTMYKWIEKNNYPTNLQLLCHNCNMGRHLNGGICPHKSDN